MCDLLILYQYCKVFLYSGWHVKSLQEQLMPTLLLTWYCEGTEEKFRSTSEDTELQQHYLNKYKLLRKVFLWFRCLEFGFVCNSMGFVFVLVWICSQTGSHIAFELAI